jgi:hypothetical protein
VVAVVAVEEGVVEAAVVGQKQRAPVVATVAGVSDYQPVVQGGVDL